MDARGRSLRQYRRLRLTAELRSSPTPDPDTSRWARNVKCVQRSEDQMNVIRLFGVLGVTCALGASPAAAQKSAVPKPPKPQISAATREKAAEDNANPDALVLVDFQKR